MKNFTPLKNILFYSTSLIIVLSALYSCSSSQPAYSENDGIYGAPEKKSEVVMVRDTRTDYYQNYFSGENENSQEIFTDIDAYEGYSENDTVYVENYDNGNPPWEKTASSVSVSINVGVGWGYGGCNRWGGYYWGMGPWGGYGLHK